jgi:glycosyltransferase involved in cell wall biosynthesis
MISMEDRKSTLISIITITLNAEKYLEQTIQSVLNQTYKYIEYIVVDGGSTDRTVEIINKYKNQIDHFISENDKGIADAMNKGVALATGDYIVFLHADDYFKNDSSLEKALEFFKETNDIIACSIQFGEQLKIYKPRGFNFWTNFKGIPHQGTLCRRSLIEKLNGFDKQFQICMDYDFFLRAYRNRARLVKVPVILAVMRDTGISSRQDCESLKIRFDEERRVHEKNCRSFTMSMLYKLYWCLYLPYRKVFYSMKKRVD